MRGRMSAITNILFQIWYSVTPSAPMYSTQSYRRMIQDKLTSGWVYKLYLNDDIYRFFAENPHPEFPDIVELFNRIESPAHKSDLFRYYHIYMKGGIYLDSDAMIYEPINSIVKDYDFICVESTLVEKSFFQGVIGAAPKNPIIYDTLKSLYTMDISILKHTYHQLCYDIFRIYHEYNGDKRKCHLFKEINDGRDIVDTPNPTVLFRHFWNAKDSIPLSYAENMRLTPTKRNLVYFSVFYNSDYFRLASLLMKSMRLFSSLDSFDILVLTQPEFSKEAEKLGVRIHYIPLTTVFEAACARLRIIDYPNIDCYDKILYLDTDIIIKKDLAPLFETPLEDRLYGLECGTISSPSFGCQFFDFTTIKPNTTGINSGTLLFNNCSTIRDLFRRIRVHTEEFTGPTPYCMDQPFINYHAIKDSLYENQLLKPNVSLYEGDDAVDNYATSAICHFSFPIGNSSHKYARMAAFFKRILEEKSADAEVIYITGRTYSWNNQGWIKFCADGRLETTWGVGIYYAVGYNRFRADWHNHFHVLQFTSTLDKCTSVRVQPMDFDVVECSIESVNTPDIVIYGNSHAHWLFNGLQRTHLNLWEFSVTMHRIGRDGVINGFSQAHLGPNRTFCLVYGEVDVRCHIGKQVSERQIDEICETLVSAYLQTIKATITDYKAIVVVGVPPPVDPADHVHEHGLPFVGTNEERVAYTRTVNDLLRKGCAEHGYRFCSPFESYTRADGCLDYSFSDECIHIRKNGAFLEAFNTLVG